MLYYSLIAMFVVLLISLMFIKVLNNNKKVYHYFIVVKNGQVKLEWIIRKINFRSWLKGEEKRLTVFDLGSSDDTIAILERLIYPKKQIDYFYKTDYLLKEKIDESKKNNEIPIIIYI
ncbi:MAG: hypothetical protein AB7V16_09055 [Vulcanibacillus sp.]